MYDSEDDTDYVSEDSYTNIVYEPDEPNKTRYCIALCELYNKKIHGFNSNIIEGYYLTNCRYKIFHTNWIYETAEFINHQYKFLDSYKHNLFPNYRNIVLRETYVKPEIIECIYIEETCVAILKTFWLKIIQRFWKNIFRNRLIAYKNRKNIYAIQYNERNGKWPTNCYSVGGLRGMLAKLKR